MNTVRRHGAAVVPHPAAIIGTQVAVMGTVMILGATTSTPRWTLAIVAVVVTAVCWPLPTGSVLTRCWRRIRNHPSPIAQPPVRAVDSMAIIGGDGRELTTVLRLTTHHAMPVVDGGESALTHLPLAVIHSWRQQAGADAIDVIVDRRRPTISSAAAVAYRELVGRLSVPDSRRVYLALRFSHADPQRAATATRLIVRRAREVQLRATALTPELLSALPFPGGEPQIVAEPLPDCLTGIRVAAHTSPAVAFSTAGVSGPGVALAGDSRRALHRVTPLASTQPLHLPLTPPAPAAITLAGPAAIVAADDAGRPVVLDLSIPGLRVRLPDDVALATMLLGRSAAAGLRIGLFTPRPLDWEPLVGAVSFNPTSTVEFDLLVRDHAIELPPHHQCAVAELGVAGDADVALSVINGRLAIDTVGGLASAQLVGTTRERALYNLA